MSLTYILEWFIATMLEFYHWTDSIYPFADFPTISLFWLFESTFLTSLVWQLFPHELDRDFSEDDERDRFINDYEWDDMYDDNSEQDY